MSLFKLYSENAGEIGDDIKAALWEALKVLEDGKLSQPLQEMVYRHKGCTGRNQPKYEDIINPLALENGDFVQLNFDEK